jgi:hypothetical protein
VVTKELDMTEPAVVEGKRRLWPIVLAEAVFLAAAVAAMFYLDLGWIGAFLIAAVVAVFTVMIFRAGEQKAREQGNFSPAMGRYNRRMLAASAVYVVGLFGAIWAHDNLGLNTATAFLFALAPSIGVLMMVAAMARLIVEETDEYLRHRYVRASLFGLGALLTIATVWGFFEQFDLVPHAPSWMAVPVFAIGLGVAHCRRWGRP